MTKEKLRSALKNSDRKENGLKLRHALANCEKGKDVLDLLHRTMSDEDIRERIANVSDLDAVNRYKATRADIRMQVGTHRHQDFVYAAAQKWCDITQKDVRSFKSLVNKDLDARANVVSMERVAGRQAS